MDKSKLMNDKGDLIKITPAWTSPIAKGTLVGFMGLGFGKITAAYQVYRVNLEKRTIEFVLYTSTGGRPCLDIATMDHSDLYINNEPIIVDVVEGLPFTVVDRIKELLP